MMKKIGFLILAVILAIFSTAAFADDGQGSLVASDAPQIDAAVAEAVQAVLPDATIEYAHLERDDGRTEWEVIYRTSTGNLGSCTVRTNDHSVREIRTYENTPADALGPEAALDVLRAEKGEFTLIELELDYDDGSLCYEGTVDQNGKYYEFEITVSGRMIEWSRD